MQTDLIKPKPLGKGDTIGIVAPASSFDADNFKKGVKKLRSRGYKIKYERSIFSQYCHAPDMIKSGQSRSTACLPIKR